MKTIYTKDLENISAIENLDNRIFLVDDLSKLTVRDMDTCVRLEMIIIFVCKRGMVQIGIDGHEIKVTAGEILLCVPQMIISSYLLSPDIEGGVVFFSTAKVDNTFFANKTLWNGMKYLNDHHVIKPNDEEWDILSSYSNIIKITIRRKNIRYRTELANTLLHGFLMQLFSIVDRLCIEVNEGSAGIRDSDYLFQRFIVLLTEHKGRLRTVSECADKLCVTPKYLTMAVKRVSGKTALAWIHEVACKEIEQAIKFSGLSIKEIAFAFNFSNLSFFARFFKSKFGMSPMEYRKQLAGSSYDV